MCVCVCVCVQVDIGAAAQGAFGVVLEDVVHARNQTYMPATDIPGGDYKYYGVNYTDPRLCEKVTTVFFCLWCVCVRERESV